MSFRTLVTASILLAVFSACSSPGTLVARQDVNQFPVVRPAPKAGAYGLFVAGESEPLFSYQLHEGEKVGFEQATAATVGNLQVQYLYAVYGDRRFRLDNSRAYEWRWLYAPTSK